MKRKYMCQLLKSTHQSKRFDKIWKLKLNKVKIKLETETRFLKMFNDNAVFIAAGNFYSSTM